MPKLDIGVGEEFPIGESKRDEECARRPHDHHHHDHNHSHWHERWRTRFSRGAKPEQAAKNPEHPEKKE